MEKNISVKSLMKRVRELEGSLKISRDYSKKLEGKIRALESQKKMLLSEEREKSESQRKAVLKGREVGMRDSLIKNLLKENRDLGKKLSRISELEMIAKDGCVPVIAIDGFEKDLILEKEKSCGLNGFAVFFRKCGSSLSAARMLVSLQPKVVIADLDESAAETLRNAEIAVVRPESVKLARYGEFLAARAADIETRG